MKGIVVAGTASGVGKTTLTLGLTAALRRRGLVVQPFKVGPDYIDPSYHAIAAGRPCRNLDAWMLPEAALRELFARATRDADVAIVEGVMGLFDGRSGEGEVGSTAHVARLLGLPVVLVLDAAKTARSAAATALGFARFDCRTVIVGCVLNNAAGDRHRQLVRDAVEGEAGLPVLGALDRDPKLRLEERYLGLVPTAERSLPDGLLDRLATAVERDIDLDRLLVLAASVDGHPAGDDMSANEAAVPRDDRSRDDSSVILSAAKDLRSDQYSESRAESARRSFAALRMTRNDARRTELSVKEASDTPHDAIDEDIATVDEAGDLASPKGAADANELFPTAPIPTRVRIGVARDAAFSFYYEDNLDLLRAWGAELVAFSPLDDPALPPGLGGLYLGGGFPELFAERLAQNTAMLDDVRRAARAGMPIVAECGGLMYLGETLTDRDGRRHRMAGVLPTHSTLEKGRLTLGYREVVALRDSPLLRAGERVRGHEFHWSVSPAPPATSAACRLDGADERLEGFASDSILASYVHLHFGWDVRLAPRFVDAAATWADQRAARRITVTGTDRPVGSSDVEDDGSDVADEGRGSPDHELSQSNCCRPFGALRAGSERSEGFTDSADTLAAMPASPEVLRCAQDDRDGGPGAPAPLATTGIASSPAIIAGRLLRTHGYPPRDTEQLSMRRIVERSGDRLPPDEPERSLVARLVYAAGDPALIPDVRWSVGAIEQAVAALRRGSPLVVDVRMVAAGLDGHALEQLGVRTMVGIDAPGADEVARRDGITRSAAGILALGSRVDGAVVAIGNAPTALLALLDLVESGVARPAAVIGFPVGFVAAAESKDELVASGLPYLTILGTRGGSPLATAAVNCLARLALSPPDSTRQAEMTDRSGAELQVTRGDNPRDERHTDHAAAR